MKKFSLSECVFLDAAENYRGIEKLWIDVYQRTITRAIKQKSNTNCKNKRPFLRFRFQSFIQVDGQTEIKQVNGQVNWCKNKLAQLNMRIEMLIGRKTMGEER